MAGGIGSRFWPMSRTNRPKQFLDILGTGKTLIQQTYERFTSFVPPENIWFVTSEQHVDAVRSQLPHVDPNKILAEPMRKNTAPCIAYAAYKINQVDPDATMIVAPSDHIVLNPQMFEKCVEKGLEYARNNDALVTLGIRPSRPDTGYGYIQYDEKKILQDGEVFKVKTFTEKPNLEMAKFFLESGEFLWNSGIFIFSNKAILSSLEKYMPELNYMFVEAQHSFGTDTELKTIHDTYVQCPNTSIDIGVMEKAKNVFVVPSEFGWSDLGTWGSLYEHSKLDKSKNAVVSGPVMLFDTERCIVNVPKDKLVVVQGLKDCIVAESDGVLLICRKEDEQEIREFVNSAKVNWGEKYI